MNTTLLIGIVVTGAALLFNIISTAIPYWWSSDNANIGLFSGCFKITSYIITVETCRDIGEGADWVKATRAMMILSILGLGSSILLSILFGFVMRDKQFLALGSAFMCVVAAGFVLLGVIIYGAKASDSYKGLVGGSLHAGFGLAIIAMIASAVAGVIVFLSMGRNDQ